jgi:hypothetical protein
MAGRTLIETVGGVLVARTIGGFFSKISKRIFPFKGSSDEERMLYQHNLSEQQQETRRQFDAQLHAMGMANQREINLLTAFFNRQTTLQNSILTFSNNLKSKMFDEALKNYPLNIPPLVLLQNAGVSINSVTGELVIDDPISKEILSIADNGANQKESLLSRYKSVFRNYPIALNVFVTPLMMDSRVSSRERTTALVWDNIFQSLESLFVNEYNRSGERPINFYPAAWNQNAKPGLHAAEILYFFTKGMPVVVLEPRYDGKQIRFLFSCWGIGSEPEKQIRQEIVFNLNWNGIILPAMYKRSVEALKKINQLKEIPQVVADAKKKLEHNMFMYEKLRDIDGIENNPITEDINKLFFLNSSDYAPLSKLMADALGISISLIADVHHLTSRGINPHFPDLLDSHFNEAFQSLTKPERHELMEAINGLMKSAYMELLLGDYDSEHDFSSFEASVEEHFELIDSAKGIIDNLEQISETSKDDTQFEPSSDAVPSVEIKTIPEILKMIDDRCISLKINKPSLSERVEELRERDSDFVSMVEDLCEQQLVTLKDIIGR